MDYNELQQVQTWADEKMRRLEDSRILDPNLDTLIRLQQLRIQTEQVEALQCVAGSLIEMEERQKAVQEEHEEPSEGYQMFENTIRHGMELLASYVDSYKGLHEMEDMSEELKNVLSHFRTAGLLWIRDFEMEDEDSVTQ